jgi:hypothetical protein
LSGDTIDPNRTRYVFELLFTAVNKLGGDFPLNLSIGIIGDTDAPCLGNALKPGCYVHAVAKDVLAFDKHIAHVNADAKQHLPILR